MNRRIARTKATLLLFYFCIFTFDFVSAQLPSYLPTNGLVGWWPFNGNANDESGNGNHGTVNGATLTTDRFGNVGKAYGFDGQSNYIQINNSTTLNNSSISISGWFNTNSLATDEYLGAKGIVGKWWQSPSECNSNYNAYLLCLTKPGNQSSTFIGGATNFYAGNVFYANSAISIGNWIHFVFTHNAESGGLLFINGNLVNVNNNSGSICNSINPLHIGADINNGMLYRFFNGSIDDIAIYNRALTQAEITALYTASSTNNNGANAVNPTPPGIPYQAVVRNANGHIMANAPVTAQFIFHKDSANGAVEYQENHALTTNNQGLINTVMGKGTAIMGSFANINWANTNKFLQVKINAGSGMVDLGTQQLMSVPYAMYAGNVTPGPQGATGPQGNQGPQGEQGLQGLKGDSGISVRSTIVHGDSLYVTLSNGQTLNAGHVRGATGFLQNGTTAGNTPYYNGSNWVTNSSNIYNNGGNVGIKTNTPHASAALEIQDTARGILIPRMTMAQRNAIQNPAEGLMVYQTDSSKGYWYWDGAIWSNLALKYASQNGDILYWNGSTWEVLSRGGNRQVLTICNGSLAWTTGGLCPGIISSINCSLSTDLGTLTQGVPSTNVTSVLSYSGGNEGSHNGQIVNSNGVTGLTATLSPGVFTSGSGNLTYTITGTPTSSGTASFAVNIGGKACTLNRVVTTVSISSINCNLGPNDGSLTQGVVAVGVSSKVSYEGGNGSSHNGQIVNSTGVTGLTATLSPGVFASGSGTLTYTITGTPSSSGTASFAINIGGQNCLLSRTVSSLSVGSYYGGGVVAYIFQPGDNGYILGETHGIIAAPINHGPIQWGCQGTPIGGLSSNIGAGLYNTFGISAGCSNTSIAARICYDLTLNGYSDWYLPSQNELQQLLNNRIQINNTSFLNGGSAFVGAGYWSSSEFSSNQAYHIEFHTGTPSYTLKGNSLYIRAIRYF